jgi:dephospho-CoA kinase
VIVAGLTGGIGTGKSTVAAIFEEAGAIIIDADKIAKEVVAPGRPAWQKIVTQFGRNVLLPDGGIDRKRLADIIFNAPQQKNRLDRIVHPLVIAETERRLKEIERDHPESVVILDIPLLIEAGMDRDLAEIIVVYVPEAIQLKRLMRRDRLNATEALARIGAQMPIDEKKTRASILIDNSASPAVTRKIALKVFKDLQRRSRRRRRP